MSFKKPELEDLNSRIQIIRCKDRCFCENKNTYKIEDGEQVLRINSDLTFDEIYKLEGIKRFKESNKEQFEKQKFDEYIHVTETLVSNCICPKCKNSDTIIFFDYPYLYEMNVEYFDHGTMNIKCNKCDFEDNFYEFQGHSATGDSLINKLWSQYLEYWGYWNLEFKSGDKCPKCGHLFYSLDEDEKFNFGDCCGDTNQWMSYNNYQKKTS